MRKVSVFWLFIAIFLLVSCTERRQEQLLDLAEERTLQGKYTEAAELFRKAVTLNPEGRLGVKALYKLGFTLETYLKDYDAALFNFNEFVRLSQDKVAVYEVLKRIANIYFDQNKENDKAISSYKKLLDLSPDSLEVDLFQFRIAQSYFRANNFDQARLEYNDLIRKFPKSQFVARSRFEIGNTYYMEAKYDIAQEALKQVMRYHPQSEFAVEAEFLLGQCLEQQNKLPAALISYESVLEKYPSKNIIQFRIEAIKKRIKKEK